MVLTIPAISQCCEDPSGHIADSALDTWLILGFADARRFNSGVVALSKLVICCVD